MVEHLWVEQGGGKPADWRIVADTPPHVIATVWTASAKTCSMRVALVGARSCAATISVAHRVLTVGLRLKPGVLPIVTSASAREFADRSIAVDHVFSPNVLADLELSPDAPVSVIVRDLVRLVRRACHRRTVKTILPDASSRTNTVSALAASLSTPTRSLHERAYREVGLSPKRILRMLRLHDALHAAQQRGSSWSHVAYVAGCADQAHLTRELRALLGETPSAWRARGSAVLFKTEREHAR